ncbi:MAG: NUDIX hydrolase [bacterium]|nr:NUDIX hydrolase [bacterium]
MQRVSTQPESHPEIWLARPPSVMVVPVLEGADLLLVEHDRPLVATQHLEFPGGGVEPGETPRQAAVRETLEETGFLLRDAKLLGRIFPSNGASDEVTHVFCAQASAELGSSRESGVRVVTMSREELANEVDAGHVTCAVTLAALHLHDAAQRRGGMDVEDQ